MEFTGKLGKYKIIETEDQTKTLWSEYFDENCHNLSGAYAETIYNYIEGCNIPDQISSEHPMHILDVGFGVGVGLNALINELKKYSGPKSKTITYTSMELDEELFLWSIRNNLPAIAFQKIENYYSATHPDFPLKMTVFIGDGRKTIPEAFGKGLLPNFTAIFQDAFSPKKNPTLWTVEWFDDLRRMSDEKVYMSTYSSSMSIRKSMIAAGWALSNAKGFGQKRTMTKARLIGETDPSLAAELSKSKALELKDI